MKGKVDILDLVEITITTLPPQGPQNMCPVAVDIIPYDKTKMLFIDESEMTTFNHIISERAKQLELDPRNPQATSYLKEFTARWLSEMYRNGLAELDNVPEGHDDPYAKVRKWQRPN